MRRTASIEETKWEVKSLDLLCDLLNGLAFKPEDWTEFGLPIIRIQNLNGGTEFNFCDGSKVPKDYIITPGTLLFSWSGNRGTSFGPYIWNGPVGVLNQHIFKVTEKSNVNPHWLFYALDEVRQKAERVAHGGSGLVHVRRGDLLLYAINTPLEDEQNHIAEILDTIETAIRRTDMLINKLNWMRMGLLQDLLTRGLNHNGKLRDPVRNSEQFKNSPLGLIPKEWEARTLERTATLQRGFDLPVQNRTAGTVPVYGSNGIDGYHNKASVSSPGVITGRSGSIGFVFYSETPYWPLNTTLYVKNFHGNEPKFIVLLLEFLRLARFTAATGVPSLNRNFVHPMFVAVPPPEEQKLIVDTMEHQLARLKIEENNRHKLVQIKKGLMTDLLTGSVRVPTTKSEVVTA